jgi:hypothetical protein
LHLICEIRSVQVILVVRRRRILAKVTIISVSRKRAAAPVPVDGAVTTATVEVIILTNRAPGAVTAVTTLRRAATRRVSSTTGARTSTTGRRAGTASTRRVTTSVESPAGRGRGTGPLNLQVVVASDAAAVHLIVSIISIATRFILHKRKSILQARRGSSRRWNIAADKTTIPLELVGKVARAGSVRESRHIEGGTTTR